MSEVREIIRSMLTIGFGWVLWSWRRAVAVFAAALLLTGLASHAAGRPKPRPAPHRHAATAAAGAAEKLTPVTVTVAEPARTVRLDPAAIATVGGRFTRAWIRRALPPAQWRAGVRPYVTPRLAGLLAVTDPAAVPTARVTGDARLGEAGGPGKAAVTVPTSVGAVVLGVEYTAGRWLVDTVNLPQ
jgi:hypothetical protein